MFEKVYKNKEISKKYFNKYKLLNNFNDTLFIIPRVIKMNKNKLYFENIIDHTPLNYYNGVINYNKLGKILYKIHLFLGKNKIHSKQSIHGDYCLQNILIKNNINKYIVIDFESPKEHEGGNKYLINNPYLDLGIFIMKLITSKPIYISFFINYKIQITNFLIGYSSIIDTDLLIKYTEIEFNRFLKGIKKKSIKRYILWKIYFKIYKYKLLQIGKNKLK